MKDKPRLPSSLCKPSLRAYFDWDDSGNDDYTKRPALLDLFAGGGGAAMGYYLAGFRVVGIDNRPQPHYPFEFHLGDALTYPLEGFDAYHASPPCQHYSSATLDHSKHPDLYALTRYRLKQIGKPYIIENVIGAPYGSGIVLCGSMFDLTVDGEWIERHRNFETSWLMFQPSCKHRCRRAITVTGKTFVTEVREYKHSRQAPFTLAQRLMGINWMNRKELVESIPPSYTEYIGKYLMQAVLRRINDR